MRSLENLQIPQIFVSIRLLYVSNTFLPHSSIGKPAIINMYTLVIQEYFQERVKAWLDTVGKELIGIKHHWLRYEFAPSRGQIHAHMIVICDNKDVLSNCLALKHDRTQLAFPTYHLGLVIHLA